MGAAAACAAGHTPASPPDDAITNVNLRKVDAVAAFVTDLQIVKMSSIFLPTSGGLADPFHITETKEAAKRAASSYGSSTSRQSGS
jgi:hypothetical protein